MTYCSVLAIPLTEVLYLLTPI